MVVELLGDFLADAFPVFGMIEDFLWNEFFAAFDGEMIRQPWSAFAARLFGFGGDFFSPWGVVVCGLSQVVGVVEEEV